MRVVGEGCEGVPAAAGFASGVTLLHPQEQVFTAMLTGWRNQQLARRLALSRTTPRVRCSSCGTRPR